MSGVNDAVPIRLPATANLMVDSADRNTAQNPSPFDFQISRPNSILNGFFNRIGTTEVVLEWNEPNGAYLSTLAGQNPVQVLVSTPSGLVSSSSVIPAFNPNEFYNAAAALDTFCAAINADIPSATVAVVNPTSNLAYIAGGDPLNVSTNALTIKLGLASDNSLNNVYDLISITDPDLRPFRYLDFASVQLTYNQELKDSSTAFANRDVLCRWYFAWDQQPQRDTYQFPIEMGYEPFKVRRLFNPPKQIRWDSKQPIGNISFQVFGNNSYTPVQPVSSIPTTNFLMTLQASEN